MTVCAPALVAVQMLPVQEPLGAIANVVEAVTSPSGLPAASKPWAVKVCEPPAVIVELAGLSPRWSGVALVTWSEAVPLLPELVPVTV